MAMCSLRDYLLDFIRKRPSSCMLLLTMLLEFTMLCSSEPLFPSRFLVVVARLVRISRCRPATIAS